MDPEGRYQPTPDMVARTEAHETLTMARRPAAPVPEVFLDASYFLAAIKVDALQHPAALRWARHFDGRPQITTTLALTEAADKHLTRERWRLFDRFFAKLRTDPLVTIVAVDAARLDRAVDLKRTHPSKGWGLADCVAFTVMRDHGVTEALSADDHFNQAGFDALLLRA